MAADPKTYAEAIIPAADVAVSLARLMHAETGQLSHYVEEGGLGFGFEVEATGTLSIMIEWQGSHRMHIRQPANAGLPRLVQTLDDDGPWIKEMTDALRALEERLISST
jgi:hypothetical protein